MKRSTLTTVLLATLSCGTVWAATPPVDYKAMQKSDAELSQRINQQLLADPNLTAKDWEGLTVSVKNGKAILQGEVTSVAALKEVRQVASREAESVDSRVTTKEEAKDLRDASGMRP